MARALSLFVANIALTVCTWCVTAAASAAECDEGDTFNSVTGEKCHVEADSTASPVTWQTVFMFTLPMALVSGLGGVPFFFVGKLDGKAAGIANSLAYAAFGPQDPVESTPIFCCMGVFRFSMQVVFFYQKNTVKHCECCPSLTVLHSMPWSRCGVMLSASFNLIYEGQPFGRVILVLGLFLGAVR